MLLLPPSTGAERVDHALSLCLLGAADDTGNLGVTALNRSFLAGVSRRSQSARLIVFDNGLGERPGTIPVAGRQVPVLRRGARLTRRYYRAESIATGDLLQRIGLRVGSVVRTYAEVDAAADVSGGDSFTDLYGEYRFELVTRPKEMALRAGLPLVLLPQTYGPFTDPVSRDRARRIVAGSAQAWARDERSFEALRDLAGDDFDPSRHRAGVDLAFLLEPLALDAHRLPLALGEALAHRDGRVLAGVNVSGMLYNDPGAAAQYGISLDYHALVDRVVRHLLRDDDTTVVLVPHVDCPALALESDVRGCLELRNGLTPAERERVLVAPVFSEPGEAKWLISQLDWFCGSRMHATIAALSTGVPAAAIAYSLKTLGVFETAGAGKWVAEAHRVGDEEAFEIVAASWAQRDTERTSLAGSVAVTKAHAEAQLDELVATFSRARATSRV